MEITTIIQYLVAWGLLVLAQSVFINGVYQSATGETKKRVDGTEEDSEMVLYPLKKFFEKTKKIEVFYTGKYLMDLFQKIYGIDPGFTLLNFKRSEEYYLVPNSFDILNQFKENIPFYEKSLGIKIRHFCNNQYSFRKEYEYYVYSKWLRKPIIQCIKCMASFWGGLTYWPVVLFLFGFHWLEIPLFFADMFSLTYINWILYKKAQ